MSQSISGDKTTPSRRTVDHPQSGQALMSKLRQLLAHERGYRMTFERIGRIIGKSTSTTAHWFGIFNQPHVRAFICLLERLSEEERLRYLRGVCRTLPTVLHPRLAHSPPMVRALLETLGRPCGLTIIRGGTEVSRTFLLTALGHTFPQLHARHPTAGGLDIFPPEKFVPVETLIYLPTQTARDRLRRMILEVWPEVQKSSAPLLLFNGVWTAAAEVREEMLDWSRHRQVVIADTETPDLKQLARQGVAAVQVLTVSQIRENSLRIQVACQQV